MDHDNKIKEPKRSGRLQISAGRSRERPIIATATTYISHHLKANQFLNFGIS